MSIMILTVAILPMVGMFDAGLRAAVIGSNYDTARALAKKQLESAQSLKYGTVETTFPTSPAAFDASGLSETSNRTDGDALFASFRYEVRKQYVRAPSTGTATFENANADTGLMKITVTVCWNDVDATCANGNGNEYSSTGLKTR